LNGISGVAANDVWAVGTSSRGGGRDQHPLTRHWDGQQWTTVSCPLLPGHLEAVVAVATNDVWAVGDIFTGGGTQILILHWDGVSWTRAEAPDQPGQYNNLSGVTATSAGEVLAIGNYSVSGEGPTYPISLRWDGTQWSQSEPALTGILAIDAVSTNDAWAVGQAADKTTLAKHWDGTHWRRVKTPNSQTPDRLTLVTAISPDDVWAVGESTQNQHTFTEHWDGRRWALVEDGIATRFAVVAGLSGTTDDDAWLAGYDAGSVILQHWDGESWQPIQSPASAHSEPFLTDVESFSRRDAWAVGSYYLCTGHHYCHHRRILMHWNGSTWRDYHGH
jgi:hypothetical protein